MHISLGGLFNICENGGGGLYAPPEKLWRILCYSIVVVVVKKLGQHDLNKKIYRKICKKRILNF